MSNYKLPDREKYEKTQRGFAIFGKFKDRYGSEISVVESSIAFEPCVWIFTKNEGSKDMDPHLTPDQAKDLIRILQRFIDASALEEPSEQ